MSRESVELVERAFAAYREGGIDAVMPLCSADVVWHFDAEESVEDLAYRGRDGIRGAYEVWIESLEDFGWDVHEIRDLGERVLVLADITGVSRDTGVAARVSTNLLADVRDGLIHEVHTFIDLDRALAAAAER